MARCIICDSMMETETIDPRDNRPIPCTECMEVITEAVEPPEFIDPELGFGEWGVPEFMNGV